jgi:signal transduction histidine kinase
MAHGAFEAAVTHKWIESIRRAAVRMKRLVEDMLDLARIEAGTFSLVPTAFVVDGLLAEALELHRDDAARAGLVLRIGAERSGIEVTADRDRLLQVLDNLIANAIKFTPEGGEVVLRASAQRGEIVFAVADTGCGVPPELRERLFDRFWQAQAGDRRGAGLGLSIARGIVASHGGRIWLDSQVDEGSTFWFAVPAAPP